MKLPFVRNKLTEDVKFIYVGLAIDVKQRLVDSLDKTMGFGDRVNMCKFSPYRRGYKGGNYFDHGVNKDGVQEFVSLVRNQLEKYAR